MCVQGGWCNHLHLVSHFMIFLFTQTHTGSHIKVGIIHLKTVLEVSILEDDMLTYLTQKELLNSKKFDFDIKA